jgi:hypothetical protein
VYQNDSKHTKKIFLRTWFALYSQTFFKNSTLSRVLKKVILKLIWLFEQINSLLIKTDFLKNNSLIEIFFSREVFFFFLESFHNIS